MLNSIRNKTKGWVAYLIVGMITIPFALFGVSEYFTGDSNIIVASIGNDDISKEAYLKEFNAIKRRLQKELGEGYTDDINSELRPLTIQSMINRRILNKLADESGYAITPRELWMFIQTNDAFKVEGKFSIDKYKQLLRLKGFSDIEYESIQTEELIQNQIKYNLLDSAFVTPLTLKRMQSLNNQQRKFSYIALNIEDYTDKAEIDPKSVRDFFDKNKQIFFEPQKVKVNFVELSTEKIAKSIKVNDDNLLSLYEDEKALFSTEEERKAQHILVESEELANTIAAQLKQSKSFTKLATKYSQDKSSRDNGGDLGFFTKGTMVPEFDAKVFSMKENEVSAPLKTSFGYHIIKLNKIKAAKTKTFEVVRSELTKIYTEREVQKSIYKLTEQLSNLSYELGLEEAAKQMDLEFEVSEFFTQDTRKYDVKFVAAAYSDVVLNKGENSKLIELSKDKFMILKINKKITKRQKKFDEAKLEITKHLSSLLAKTFIDKIANKISTSLNAGDTGVVQKLIDEYKLKWKDVGWVERGSKQEDIGIINSVFSLPKPNNGATYGAQSLNKQRSVVLKLSAIKVSKGISDDILSGVMLNFESEELFDSILRTLRKNTNIEIFTDRL